jgi:hypothetical protein
MLAAFGLLAATQRLGLLALAAAAAGVAALLLAARPALAVATLGGAVLLLESDPTAAFSGSAFYSPLAGFQVYPVEVLAALAAVAVLVDAGRRGRLESPGAFAAPLGILVLGLIAGAVTGVAAGADQEAVQEGLRVPALLVLVPLLAAHALRPRPVLRRVVLAAALLAGAKALVGVLAVATAIAPVALNDVRATYIESAANFAALLLVLGVLSLRLTRAHVPRWADALALVAFASLVLSYRRSYWIATVACLILVVAVALSPSARTLVLPALAVVVLGAVVAISGGSRVELDGPVGDRVAQLSPAQLRSDPQDRYRIGERRNVLEEIRRSPLAGIGVGVEWRAVHPMSLEHPDGRRYVHVASLWFWLKLGLLGLVAYVAIIATALVTGVRAWRRHPDPVLAAAALAGGVALVGLAVAETTATFVGADPRMTVLVGVLLGALAALRADAGSGPVLR